MTRGQAEQRLELLQADVRSKDPAQIHRALAEYQRLITVVKRYDERRFPKWVEGMLADMRGEAP